MKTLLLAVSLLLSLTATPLTANQWFPSIQVVPPTPGGIDPVVQLDANGNSVALWLSPDSTTLFSGTLPFEGSTWNILTVRSVVIPPGTTISQLNLGLKADGGAVAVWRESGPDGDFISYSSLPFGGASWTLTIFLSPTSPPFNADDPITVTMGVDANGDANVLWEANNSGSGFIRTAIVPFGSLTAPTPTTLDGPISLLKAAPVTVSVNPSGQAIATWVEGLPGPLFQIVGAFYSSGWTVTPLIAQSRLQLLPQTAINDSGNGIIVWHTNTTPTFLEAATFSSPNWTLTNPINSFPINVPRLLVDIDDAGDAVVTYFDATGNFNSASLASGQIVWGNYQFVTASGVPAEEALDTIPSGLSTVVWTDKSTSQFLASMLSNPLTTPWGAPVTLSNTSADLPPTIAGNPQGEFITVWQEVDGSLRSAFFGPIPGPPSPLNVQGVRIANQFLLQKELSDHFSWSPFTTVVDVVAYQIYRDSALTELVGQVSANTYPLQFTIHNVQNTPQTYYIVSVNHKGIRSVPVVITL